MRELDRIRRRAARRSAATLAAVAALAAAGCGSGDEQRPITPEEKAG
jgi:hypothetical protein